MAVWPVSLPTSPLLGSYVPGIAQSAITTEMEQGPPKKRRRFVAASKVETMELHMTEVQWAALATFYETTTGGGVLQFTMFDPLGGSDREVRFSAVPTATQSGFGIFRVSLVIEVLPT